ncbi:D-glycero-alpha-D-manno-heptose-1,7-bisphosphate 7-phosphatase [Achromobacter ruhlandii]|uniref:D,D-heptose 1,7-bisphosphate phosphatase n=1 Tax=Achromobacter ruhlandii TaxID=72557 RepID=A0ABM8M1B0_9BURK|nr:HAD family hydrolase [Achromobacter ruhlandii]AKP90560.1 D-glycero-D-manno-heptose 1,7-bisphosphate phosphatase [Achromobacter xylosoxidans]AOU93799.1 D-glycero-D-manno-heptose 1,7-bisphosphate phosphatase [Achromobacter ruhlandii]MCZ8432929.1 HAD family hydrolase [Achromobacter ruhlandii]MDC6090753.1 HAD family hydrolase [Achromobacter ruhlandii]MDC6152083.1 HAD family hydrolase [Achromobacter ruhlandii]
MALRPAVFLDKDGTVLADVPYNVDPARMVYAPMAFAALNRLGAAGVALVVVSNQSGVARGLFPVAALEAVRVKLAAMFMAAGAWLEGFYWCPHHPSGRVAGYAIECDCRKPRPGLLLRAAGELGLDLSRSWFIGDILDDVEAANRAGCRSLLLDVGHETEWRTGPDRTPDARAPDLDAAARRVLADWPAQRGG